MIQSPVKFSHGGLLQYAGLSPLGGTLPLTWPSKPAPPSHACAFCGGPAEREEVRISHDNCKTWTVRFVLRCKRVPHAKHGDYRPACKAVIL
jgi:hypothetical protein